MGSEFDLVVVGAGPAGLAAARQAADLGLSVLVLDEQLAPGGQIYRSIETVAFRRPSALVSLGRDYTAGLELVQRFRSGSIDYLSESTVWNVSEGLVVHFSRSGASHEIVTRNVLLAAGALERPVPIPGWTLPGVMTVGSLQILLKSSGLIPEGKIVLAGSGPLLLALAEQLVRSGAESVAIVETVLWRQYWLSLAHLPQALGAGHYLWKGLRMLCTVRKAGVPIYRGASMLEVEGEKKVTGLAFNRGGRRQRLAADIVALHQGIIPNQQATRLLGCDHEWNHRQRAFRPQLDAWSMTTIDGVWVAGDAAGIAGAKAAEYHARLAVLAIAHRLGKLSREARDRLAARERRRVRRELAIRPFLDVLYAPPREVLQPGDDVLICRCEEVTAGELRAVVRQGSSGPNQAKALLRCGMGPCQGRLCGPTVTEIIAAERQTSPSDVGYYRIRPPLKPLPLAELAGLDGPTRSPS